MEERTQQVLEMPKNFKDTESFASSMAEQLRIAGQLQRDFLPRQLPDSERLRWAVTFWPAEVVSGDIYDVARLDERHIGFYVADVVGHGMPAALLTMFLKQAMVLRETTGNSYRIFSPAEVLSNLNKKMFEQQLSGSRFVTCCYFLLNIDTLELKYARGGHPYPILIRKSGEPEQLKVQGPLVGVFENAEFEGKVIRLEAGDKLLVYSDGAEHLIGGYNEEYKFIFSEEFTLLKDNSLEQMNERLNILIREEQIEPGEIDDITTVGLEII